MVEERKDGKLDQVKGNVKETVGNLADDKSLEHEGKKDKASGKVKEATEKASDKIHETVDKFKK
ncbi:MAG TPA: CsbD family protein [Jeotgalicoccus sp.]|nr:CsbD family protein [Jeotgalicoccus sp.]